MLNDPKPEQVEALAVALFNAYNEQGPNPWKTWDGNDVPRWEQVNDQVRAKWSAVARRSLGETFHEAIRVRAYPCWPTVDEMVSAIVRTLERDEKPSPMDRRFEVTDWSLNHVRPMRPSGFDETGAKTNRPRGDRTVTLTIEYLDRHGVGSLE